MPTIETSIDAELLAFLASSPDLAAVPMRPEKAPQTLDPPYLLYTTVEQQEFRLLAGRTGRHKDRLRLTWRGRRKEDADRLRLLARAWLEPKIGEDGGFPGTRGAYVVTVCQVTDGLTAAEVIRPGSSKPEFAAQHDVILWYRDGS